MLVDIEKIRVEDRIRKDLGDISELAKDIEQNGLINPPTVTPDLVLIAGERRLAACKLLGWQQIEVKVMEVRDYEHQLRLEISENENRKDFTLAERLDWARRLEQVERLKAKERMVTSTGGANPRPLQNFAEAEAGETRDKVAEAVGLGSGETYRKAKYIQEHDPEAIERIDSGESSIHREYQRLRAELEQKDERILKLQQALEEELKKPPNVIQVEKMPDGVRDQLIKQDKQIKELQAELEALREKRGDVSELETRKREMQQELADLIEQQRKLKESVDYEGFLLNNASEFAAKFQRAAKPLKEVKGELEALGQNATFHWSVVRRVQADIQVIEEVLDMVRQMCRTVNVSNVVEEGGVIDV